jgi:hypothetical protein
MYVAALTFYLFTLIAPLSQLYLWVWQARVRVSWQLCAWIHLICHLVCGRKQNEVKITIRVKRGSRSSPQIEIGRRE